MKFNKDDIFLLLENSIVEPSEDYNQYGSGEVRDKLSGIDFINTQVNSLQKMYVQLSPRDKIKFISYLLPYIEKPTNHILAKTALNTLIHIKEFDKSFKKIISMYNSHYDNDFYLALFTVLQQTLKYEWNIFTKQQINSMYQFTSDTLAGFNTLGANMRQVPSLYSKPLELLRNIHRQLNIIKTFDLKDRIFVGTSQEITTDESALKLEFKRYNFPDDLTETLDKINLKISTASDNFDFKGCMDLIRSFSERLFKHIAQSLDSVSGAKMDEKDSEQTSKFFVSKKLIASDQGELIIALRHFLSNEGVHRLKSRPDDARLSRNMMIELALYLLLRLKDVKE